MGIETIIYDSKFENENENTRIIKRVKIGLDLGIWWEFINFLISMETAKKREKCPLEPCNKFTFTKTLNEVFFYGKKCLKSPSQGAVSFLRVEFVSDVMEIK